MKAVVLRPVGRVGPGAREAAARASRGRRPVLRSPTSPGQRPEKLLARRSGLSLPTTPSTCAARRASARRRRPSDRRSGRASRSPRAASRGSPSTQVRLAAELLERALDLRGGLLDARQRELVGLRARVAGPEERDLLSHARRGYAGAWAPRVEREIRSSCPPPERGCSSGGCCGTRRRPREARDARARAGASDSPRRLRSTRARALSYPGFGTSISRARGPWGVHPRGGPHSSMGTGTASFRVATTVTPTAMSAAASASRSLTVSRAAARPAAPRAPAARRCRSTRASGSTARAPMRCTGTRRSWASRRCTRESPSPGASTTRPRRRSRHAQRREEERAPGEDPGDDRERPEALDGRARKHDVRGVGDAVREHDERPAVDAPDAGEPDDARDGSRRARCRGASSRARARGRRRSRR